MNKQKGRVNCFDAACVVLCPNFNLALYVNINTPGIVCLKCWQMDNKEAFECFVARLTGFHR